MKKMLAVVAGLVPAITLLPATAASAEVICAPITVDGQPIFCTDTAPIDAAVQQAELALSEAIVTAQSAASSVSADATRLTLICPRVQPFANGAVIYIATESSQTPDEVDCSGEKITVTAQTTGQPVHVPQICLTTTGTCVGPVDQTVPVPATTQPLTICIQPIAWSEPSSGNGQWTDATAPADLLHPSLGCVTVH